MLDTTLPPESESAAMPILGYGLIAARLQRALGDFVETHGLGYVFSAQTSFRVGHTVEVFQADGRHVVLSDSESLHGGPLAPGFSVDLSRIFPS